MIFYFSGCGNSRFIAEQLAEKLQQKLLFIPTENSTPTPYTLNVGEPLGFVFPVYSWAPPALVLDFVEKMQFCLNATLPYTFLACTCGDETGYTHKIFANALRQRGLRLNAAFSFTMPETYINLPGFKLDTPENEHNKIVAAKQQLPLVAAKIAQQKDAYEMKIGSLPWLKSHPLKSLFNSIIITDRPFKVTNACISCGICSQVCPVNNIEMEQQKPHWLHLCVNCMACYHHCPQNAIQFGKQTIGKGQYYFGRNQ